MRRGKEQVVKNSRFLHCYGRVSNDFQTNSLRVFASRLQLPWPPYLPLTLCQAPINKDIHKYTHTVTPNQLPTLCPLRKLQAFQSGKLTKKTLWLSFPPRGFSLKLFQLSILKPWLPFFFIRSVCKCLIIRNLALNAKQITSIWERQTL